MLNDYSEVFATLQSDVKFLQKLLDDKKWQGAEMQVRKLQINLVELADWIIAKQGKQYGPD